MSPRGCHIGRMGSLAVFGDSYVDKIGQTRLNINALCGRVRYFGVPGLDLSAAKKHPTWTALKKSSPAQVFLHDGGNSTDTKTTDGTLVNDIVSMCD